MDAARGVVSVCDALADMVGSDFDIFAADQRTQWAVEMGLIRIGEGINRIPADVLLRFPDQPWRKMVAMRNFAAHQYDDLDPRRVWTTLTRDVPALRSYLVEVVIPGLS
ncbi:HepT-like ribonuclease domain-containing protein [Janibacter limosus]|uniref:DUF86 domain-containing protein n=1 Tax=Janibacter limosus TaxID=53458 RepID=A0A4P6MTB4_9MICO|nr:HepT-like ribonuclease domain-containing protein [Janibacter limosus]QBF46269.1 DUF86 domain-containing protein [Janibacter limosus]